jgi:hypothetical protein
MAPSWSWSYGSWIYNYFCNQCLSPLNLRKIAPIMASIKIAFYVYYLSIISPGMHVYVYYMFFGKITSRKLFKISFLRCSHMGTLCAKTPSSGAQGTCPTCHTLDTSLVVSSNPVHGEVYSIQYYVIQFVSDLWHGCGFLRVLRFPSPINLTAAISLKYCL